MNSLVLDNLIKALYEQVEVEITNNDYQEALVTLEMLISYVEDRPEKKYLYGRIKYCYAEINRYLGKFYPAVRAGREALEFYRCHEEYDKVFQTKALLGSIFFQYCQYSQAVSEWESALKLLNSFTDQPEISQRKAQIYMKLGEVFNILADYKKARANYLKGLFISRLINDQILIGRFQMGIGSTCHLENRFPLALQIYYRSLKQARYNNDKFLMGRLFHSFGDIFTKTGQLGKAQLNYENSLQLSEKVKDFTSTVSTLRELGRLYLKIDLKQTINYYERSFDKLIENITAETRGQCETLMGKNFYLMALYYFKIKDWGKAKKNLLEAGGIFDKYQMEKEKRRFQILYQQIKDKIVTKHTFSHKQILSNKLGIS